MMSDRQTKREIDYWPWGRWCDTEYEEHDDKSLVIAGLGEKLG